jgi:CBS domain-containing protein
LKQFIKHKTSVLVMRETDTVMAAIDQMIAARTGAVLISHDGLRLDGIISERDVMTKVTAKGRDANATKLGDIMTASVQTLNESASIEAAIETMVEHRIRHLPIVNDSDEIAGMISLRYLLHDRIRDLVDELHKMEAYINDAPGG